MVALKYPIQNVRILHTMNIYLDESYNFQKEKGKMFLSINGFSVLDDKILRKRWKTIRKPYTKLGRRIHATDSEFKNLREESLKLLGGHDAIILSLFQLIQEIPYDYYNKDGIKFDLIYSDLLKKLFERLSLGEYKKVKIILDSRTHRDGVLGQKRFKNDIEKFLKKEFSGTTCLFQMTPSYLEILLELADFISNTFYREYFNDSDKVFKQLGFRFVQIKNPL